MKYTFERPYELVTFDRFSETKNFIFSERSFKAGRKVPIHWHDYNEIEILAQGELEHTMNNETYPMTPGAGYIMSSCDFHGLTAISDVRILNLSFKLGNVDERIESSFGCGIGKFRCMLSCEKLALIEELFKNAARENGEECANDRFSEMMLKNIAEQVIVTVLRESPGRLLSETSPLIHKAIVEINNKFRMPLTVTSVAETLFVTPNYLGSCFKKNMGMTFNHYLMLTRLRHSCGLLTSSNRPVKEIAFESGFCSVEYFLSVFRKNLGMTPTAWRKEHDGGQI